jgi:hypothetical protein
MINWTPNSPQSGFWNEKHESTSVSLWRHLHSPKLSYTDLC